MEKYFKALNAHESEIIEYRDGYGNWYPLNPLPSSVINNSSFNPFSTRIKRTYVGETVVDSSHTILFYITTKNKTGTELYFGTSEDEAEARKAFEDAKPLYDNLSLCVALMKHWGSDDETFVDSQNIETFQT